MAWPDIFWGKKTRPAPETPPPFKPTPVTETSAPEEPKPVEAKPAVTKPAETKLLYPKPGPSLTQTATPPSIKPIPIMIKSTANMVPQPSKPALVEAGTRTLPAMHGVVLRSPTRQAASTVNLPVPGKTPAPSPAPAASIKDIEQLMAEADPVRTLSQSGSVRMLKRLTPEPATSGAATKILPVIRSSAKTQSETAGSVSIKPEPSPSSPASPQLSTPAPVVSAPPTPRISLEVPPPFPTFQPAATPPAQWKKPETISLRQVTPVAPLPQITQAPPVTSAPASASPSPSPSVPVVSSALPQENESPFILKPAVSLVSTPKIIPLSAPPPPPLMPFGVFRRKAKMADLARIVLPSKRDETTHLPPPAPESTATVIPPAFPVPVVKPGLAFLGPTPLIQLDELPKPIGTVPSATSLLPKLPVFSAPPKAEPEAANKQPELFTPLPKIEPKIDPQAHQPEPAAESAPKLDPEDHRPTPEPAVAAAPTGYSPPAIVPEKREFHLANGERVAGTVLSETPDAIYIEHGTLGVLTIPRGQIAKRLVEIILINGDRIVGDIMAETADTLYVRHASLGMLTVPRAQRSTRVVEAILKNGDRVLGEVLSETETFTVLKSATLGTVTIPHNQVTMLNRKIEQIELKMLPPPTSELQDKPSA